VTLLLLLGCPGKEDGDDSASLPACPLPANEAWSPELEAEVRLDESSVAWASEDGAVFDPASSDCDTPPCVRVTGPGEVHTELFLNRGVTYTLSGVAEVDGTASLRVLQNEREGAPTVIADEALTTGPFQYEFLLQGAGTTTTVELRPAAGVTLLVDEIQLTGPQWARVEATAAAPVQLAFVLHLEENQGFESDERVWSTRARIVEALSQRLAAHGAALSVQPDVTFVRGAAAFDPTWLDARAEEGIAWSAHLHDESDGAEAFSRAARGAMRGFEDAGVTLTDLNGGFGTGPWDEVGAVGYSAVSVFKSPETQGGLTLGYTTPWRLADGASAADETAFAIHDPDGPVAFIPGTGTREADLPRLPDYADRILSQVRARARPGFVNTWYLTDHVDAYTPYSDAAELEVWLDGGGLDELLAPYDRLLDEVTDPLVAAGELVYTTVPDQGAAFLTWESGCAW